MKNTNIFLRNEKYRTKINKWVFSLFVVIGIFLYGNLIGANLFFEISMTIIGGNVLLLVTFAIKDFRENLVEKKKLSISGIQKEILKSINNELLISFNQVEKKIEEYKNREELYSYLSNLTKMSLIKNLLISIFLSVAYIIIFALFSPSINGFALILGLKIYYINFFLISTFFSSLYLFLLCVVYIAVGFFSE